MVPPGYARRKAWNRCEERARDGPTTAQTNPFSTSSQPSRVTNYGYLDEVRRG